MHRWRRWRAVEETRVRETRGRKRHIEADRGGTPTPRRGSRVRQEADTPIHNIPSDSTFIRKPRTGSPPLPLCSYLSSLPSAAPNVNWHERQDTRKGETTCVSGSRVCTNRGSRSGRLFVNHDSAVGEDIACSSCTARKTLGTIGRARVSVVVYAHIMRVRANEGGGGEGLLRSELHRARNVTRWGYEPIFPNAVNSANQLNSRTRSEGGRTPGRVRKRDRQRSGTMG